MVDGRYHEARPEQVGGDRGQLRFREHEIAHDVCRVGGSGERGPRGQGQRRLQRDVAHLHRQIAARECDAIHVAGGGGGAGERPRHEVPGARLLTGERSGDEREGSKGREAHWMQQP